MYIFTSELVHMQLYRARTGFSTKTECAIALLASYLYTRFYLMTMDIVMSHALPAFRLDLLLSIESRSFVVMFVVVMMQLETIVVECKGDDAMIHFVVFQNEQTFIAMHISILIVIRNSNITKEEPGPVA